MYVQPFEGSLAPNPLSTPAGNVEGEGPLFEGAVAPAGGDNISRFVPPWPGDGAAAPPYGAAPYNSPAFNGLFGPLMGMLQQLMQMLQGITGYGGGNAPYGGNQNCRPYGNERFFQNANGSSEGDPHLAFNGARWTNMSSQPDLLKSNSFTGGYKVSTQATPPNAKGVTWNQSATVSLNNGATTVTMNNNGEPSITNYGQSLAIARGQTLGLGDGESVACEQNGSLVVTAQNAQGGRIATTLSARDNGVDVDVTAHDVDLGGALVNSYEGPGAAGAAPGPWPLMQPIAYPDE
jgi:hypothetical protein